MNVSLQEISPALKDAVRFSLVVQVFVLLIAAFVADEGQIWQMCYFGFLAFNAFLFCVLIKRRASPTATDLFLIRAGFVPAIWGTALLVNYVWGLRGF